MAPPFFCLGGRCGNAFVGRVNGTVEFGLCSNTKVLSTNCRLELSQASCRRAKIRLPLH